MSEVPLDSRWERAPESPARVQSDASHMIVGILTTSTRPFSSLRWLTPPERVHQRQLTSPRPPRYPIIAFADLATKYPIACTHARARARTQHARTQCTTTRPKPPVAARPQQVQRSQWTSLRPRQDLYGASTAMADSENRHKCRSPSFRPTGFAAPPAPQG